MGTWQIKKLAAFTKILLSFFFFFECRYKQNLFEVSENSCSKTREFIFCYRICYIRERGMQKIK